MIAYLAGTLTEEKMEKSGEKLETSYDGKSIHEEWHKKTQYEREAILKSDCVVTILTLQSRYTALYLFALSMILPPIAVTIFKVLDCVNVDPFHETQAASYRVLRVDYSEDCDSDHYRLGLKWAIAMIIM